MKRVLLLAVVGLTATACSGQTVRVAPPRHHAVQPTPAPAAAPSEGTVSASELLAGATASSFDRNDLVGPVQKASLDLVSVPPSNSDLQVRALHSPNGEAAVEVREDDDATQRWGRLLIPAERAIIAAFARNHALGQWLVIVDDVRVHGGLDPIPLTGYRWSRPDVEAYARCGIPARVIDQCTSAFYEKSQMWLMPVGSKPVGG
jgi:hypothetical protein